MNTASRAIIDNLFSKSLSELVAMGMADPLQLVHVWAWCSQQQLVRAEELFYRNHVALKRKDFSDEHHFVYDVLFEQLTLQKMIRDFGGEFAFMHAHDYDPCDVPSLSWVVCRLESEGVFEDDCSLLLTPERARRAHLDSLQSKGAWLRTPLSLLTKTRWMPKFVRKDLSEWPWLWRCVPKVSDLLLKTSEEASFHPAEAERVAQKLFMLGFEPDDGPFLSGVRNIFSELDEFLKGSPGPRAVVRFFSEHKLIFKYI